MRPRTALLAGLTALLVVGSVAPALASPQPRPVCGACGIGFVGVAEDHGVALEVHDSTARVQYHENGSTTWTVTNTVNASAAMRFRENPALLDRVAGEAARAGYGLPFTDDGSYVTVQSSRLEGDTVTIRFRHTGAAERHLGLLVADSLHTGGVRGGWILNADTFTLVGPPGTSVVNDPTSAVEGENAPAVEGRTVTWTGSVEHGYDNVFRDDVYVVFGADPAPGQSAGAVALASAPIALVNLQSFVLPPTLLFAAGVAAFALSGWRPDVDSELAAAVTAVAGAVVVAHPLYATVLPSLGGGNVPLSGLGATLLATGLAARSETAALGTPERRAALAVVGAYLLTVLLFVLPYVGGPQSVSELAVGGLRQSLLVVPVAAVYWFGVATAGVNRRARLPQALVLVGLYAVALSARLSLTSDIFGAVIVVTLVLTLLALLLAVPLFGLGRAVATRDGPGSPGESSGAVRSHG